MKENRLLHRSTRLSSLFVFLLVASGSGEIPAFGQSVKSAVRNPSGPHSTEVEWVEKTLTGAGEERCATNSYTELGTGLNYLDHSGHWRQSVPEFELIEGAAIAWRGSTRLTLSANPNSAISMRIGLPDGRVMSGRVHGLALYDPQTGQSILIAEIKDAQGIEMTPNQILYPDCFDGIKASLRYTYTLEGVEQDVILNESLPSFASLGFHPQAPENVTLEAWTEFVESPTPRIQSVLRKGVVGGQPVAVIDQQIDFGSLVMGAGRSFLTGSEEESLALVSKQWIETSDNDGQTRRFLVESVPLEQVHGPLQALPGNGEGASTRHSVESSRLEALNSLPRANAGQTQACLHALRTLESAVAAMRLLEDSGNQAAATHKAGGEMAGLDGGKEWEALRLAGKPGLVIDFSTIGGSLTNYLFKGDTTYFISSALTTYGTNTTIEGGCVIKYTNAPATALTVKTPLSWAGSLYRPVVLCGSDDNSCGDKITGSTGTPGTNYYATTALALDASAGGATNTSFGIAHLRVSNAKTAIQLIQGTNAHSLKHLQVVNCGSGIAPTSCTFSLYNGLFVNVRTNFNGSSATGDIEHLTSDGADNFQAGTTFSSLGITNSLLAGITTVGSLGTATNKVATVATGSGVFQSRLGGAHYLLDNTFRNLGSTSINAILARDLGQLTTYPPQLLPTSISADTTLFPHALRDSDLPDLGFHYAPLDYVGVAVGVTEALVLTNGVAAAGYNGSLFNVTGAGSLRSQGLAQQLNRLTTIGTVQELPQAWMTNLTTTLISGGGGQTLRYTDVSFLAGGTRALYPNLLTGTALVQDSQLRGVNWTYYSYSAGGTGATINLRNNLLERSTIDWTQGYVGVGWYLNLAWQNNLFSRCTITLAHDDASFGAWTIYDNLFDSCPSVAKTEFDIKNPPTTLGYNGYIGTTRFLSGTGDKTGLLGDFVAGPMANWIAGPVGSYYYPTNSITNSTSILVDADAVRTPAGIGLYHGTTSISLAKDGATASQSDIGWHYVATDSTGLPLDNDADGIPDYLEDANQNGSQDSGETAWQTYTSGGSLTGATGLTPFNPYKP
ncbi:MAG TPA: hypothetical protein VMF06_12470 [Candidatus Limnocylindria bacterium]|jgi:hypothetical protein|nr:hypothetical protein [Candidatus Limnocylindria bacterium]